MTDEQIIDGFRRGDSDIFRKYFYGCCQRAYYIYDARYSLSKKQNLDFMSLAHQYAIYLMEHNWKPLTDRSPNMALSTWMTNGFRYIVLDALKWYKREFGTITYEDYLRSFDIHQDLRVNFNKVIREICETEHLDSTSKTILLMLLVDGYKSKEVAALLGITPSALSQRYGKLLEKYVAPYFKHNFDMDFDMPQIMVLDEEVLIPEPCETQAAFAFDDMVQFCIEKSSDSIFGHIKQKKETMKEKRTTPNYIDRLAPNEIFVFGSNLRGMHGGGAARQAYLHFGAVMGEGVGLHGQSYAIPTMQGGVETIQPYVDQFIEYAKNHPELTFLVTRIGCGIAGFRDSEISPLFREAHNIDNIILPKGW